MKKLTSIVLAALLCVTLIPAAFALGEDINITFDANGGKGTKTVTATIGKPIGKLPTVTRAGYTFKGWYTAKSGGKKIDSSTKIIKVAKKKTFYARWTKSAKTTKSVATYKNTAIPKLSAVTGIKPYANQTQGGIANEWIYGGKPEFTKYCKTLTNEGYKKVNNKTFISEIEKGMFASLGDMKDDVKATISVYTKGKNFAVIVHAVFFGSIHEVGVMAFKATSENLNEIAGLL